MSTEPTNATTIGHHDLLAILAEGHRLELLCAALAADLAAAHDRIEELESVIAKSATETKPSEPRQMPDVPVTRTRRRTPPSAAKPPPLRERDPEIARRWERLRFA